MLSERASGFVSVDIHMTENGAGTGGQIHVRGGTASISIFCHRLSAHQTHQNPSKHCAFEFKYNSTAERPRKHVRESEKTVPVSNCLLYRH
jgi:hypothetical protein